MVSKGERIGEGWIGNLGSVDANYDVQNGSTTRSCWIALYLISCDKL